MGRLSSCYIVNVYSNAVNTAMVAQCELSLVTSRQVQVRVTVSWMR